MSGDGMRGRVDLFRRYYDLEHEVITDWDPAELSERYLELLEAGRQEGFHPVFVGWDDLLLEQLDVELGEPDGEDLRPEMGDLTRRLLLSASEYVKLDHFFADRTAELGDPEVDLDADFDLDDKQELELLDFLRDENDHEESDDVAEAFDLLLVRIPTMRPEEAFAHFPIGGVNDCPESATLVALAARWREEYGAVPAVITSDTVEFFVADPPSTVEAAAALAREHYLVCPDLVEQICDDLENLTSNLIRNAQWFFWWD